MSANDQSTASRLKRSQNTDPFTWTKEPIWQRVIRCIRLLSIHGMLTEGERDKALARAMKRYQLKRKAAGGDHVG